VAKIVARKERAGASQKDKMERMFNDYKHGNKTKTEDPRKLTNACYDRLIPNPYPTPVQLQAQPTTKDDNYAKIST
jgi:hypothetical protein